MDKEKVIKNYIEFRKLKNHTEAIKEIENHTQWFIYSSKKPLSQFDEKILIDYLNKIAPKYSTEMLNKIKCSFVLGLKIV